MKKFLVIFIGLILVAPAWANGETPAITQFVSPTTASGSATVSANPPKYDLKTITVDDQGHIASTAYVKGAHNSTLSAINYLSDNKQATLTSTNVVVDSNASSGPVVTGVSAAAGVVTVSKGEITIPVGAASGANVTSHAQIWVQ